MPFRVGYATDVGRRRSQNQDSFAVDPEIGLFVVADGMGGHRGGETASAMAVEVIQRLVREGTAASLAQAAEGTSRNRGKSSADWEARTLLQQALVSANREIFKRSHAESQFHGMGTTTTALLFKDQTLTIGHVGDSRCYFIRPGAIWQATRDHSLVQEKLRAGLITREEAKADRMRNVITRSVGFESEVNVEIYEMEVQEGDLFLMCSDGLSGMIEDTRLQEIIQHRLFSTDAAPSNDARRVQETVDYLIRTANENGGDDNITTIMIEVV